MKLYNTLSRKTEELNPLKPGEVSLYTCGPTVYLEPHIGNWRTFIFYDTLSRALKFQGLKVNHVLNITDVGHLVSDADEGADKVEQEAKVERKTAWEVARHYTSLFEEGLIKLNIQKPTHLPKATDNIPQQIELITQLEDKGVTYQTSDGIYFDTSKFKDYGKLAGIDRDKQLAGARVEASPEKRHHTDFALWKFSPANAKRDMEWESPWGKGFPGWHLECSAMIHKYLGQTIDIHAGGVDHIGVHHTNEIAQSEVASGKDLAKIWLHAEFMMVEGKKMSKSLGNVYLLSDIARRADLMAFRLLVLQSHYRTPQNFTWAALASAQSFLERINAWADLQFQAFANPEHTAALILGPHSGTEVSLFDDLDTPAVLSGLASDISTTEDELGLLGNSSNQEKLLQSIESYEQILGLQLTKREDITTAQKDLITKRELSRKDNDFPAGDKLRAELKNQGIEVEDTKFGPRWRRI